MDEMTRNIVVSRINVAAGNVEKKHDFVSREVPLHIFLGSIHFVSILCSPILLKELVVGHLLGEGVINSVDEISNINFDEESRCCISLREADVEKRIVVSKPFARLIISACGDVGYRSLSELLDSVKLKPLPSWHVKAKTILKSVRELNVLGETFRKTGGVHVTGLFQRSGKLVVSAEDVGRHNSVDKVVGAAALSGEDLSGCFLGLSGRLTGDIVLKAARVGVPVVGSLAAAVYSGVVVALRFGVTLAGFVRGERMNVYACPWRVDV
jgi:FdhD protein